MNNIQSDNNRDNSIVTMNKFIKDLLQLTPAIAFISYILLWIYLSQIHRLDLFIPSISDVTTIIPIALSFFHYLVYQIAPATPLLIILLVTNGYQHKEKKFHSKVTTIIILSFFSFITAIYLIAIIIRSDYYLTITSIVSLALTILITFYILGFNSTYLTRKTIIVVAIAMSLYFTFNSKSFSNLVTIISINKDEDVKTFLQVILITFFCVVCSCMPILYTIHAISSTRLSKLLMITSVFITILPMLIFKSLSIYSVHTTMIKIGIADWCEDIYLINNQKYTKEMFPAQYWKTQSTSNNRHLFINAVTPFRLGSNTLLCPSYLINTYDPFISMSFNVSANTIKEKNKLVTQQFQSCYVFNKSDVEKSNTTFTNIVNFRDLQSIKTCR